MLCLSPDCSPGHQDDPLECESHWPLVCPKPHLAFHLSQRKSWASLWPAVPFRVWPCPPSATAPCGCSAAQRCWAVSCLCTCCSSAQETPSPVLCAVGPLTPLRASRNHLLGDGVLLWRLGPPQAEHSSHALVACFGQWSVCRHNFGGILLETLGVRGLGPSHGESLPRQTLLPRPKPQRRNAWSRPDPSWSLKQNHPD